jgi:hypothetical protein
MVADQQKRFWQPAFGPAASELFRHTAIALLPDQQASSAFS